MKQIRALVIDDSAFMRKMLSDILESDHRIKVVGTARNGEDGLRKIKALSPDVVTLDIEMPVMDGLTTLQKIMESKPTPVVMISSLTQKGAVQTFQAISMGAIDFITKPSGSISLDIDKVKDEIISKVVVASEVRLDNHSSQRQHRPVLRKTLPYHRSIVSIGTSTGGPKALQQVLKDLPKDFPAPILIVQHMPPKFTKSLADRLNDISEITVKEASHGDILKNGMAYVAPGDYHMRVKQMATSLAIELSQDAPVHGHRPAVDVLFESLADIKNTNKIAVILTGMGRDGSKGIRAIKQKDETAYVIAESKESCIVYGMPGAAVATGLVDQIVHLEEVSQNLTTLLKRDERV